MCLSFDCDCVHFSLLSTHNFTRYHLGVFNAFSSLHPLLSLVWINQYGSPVLLAQFAIVSFSPSHERILLDLLLFDCVVIVTHLQLSGEYPLSLSILSSVKFSSHPFSNAHFLKFAKLEFHSSQILMPLFPYLLKSWLFSLLHLVFMFW